MVYSGGQFIILSPKTISKKTENIYSGTPLMEYRYCTPSRRNYSRGP